MTSSLWGETFFLPPNETAPYFLATPNGWCLENVAQLLIHCGKVISMGVLGCRAASGRTEELVVLCFYLGNACAMKDGSAEDSEENIKSVQ